jgi:hypothetical protein
MTIRRAIPTCRFGERSVALGAEIRPDGIPSSKVTVQAKSASARCPRFPPIPAVSRRLWESVRV